MMRVLFVALLAQATFSVRTEVITVPVTVADKSGRAVTSLERTAFTLLSNGRRQPITLFSSGDAPATVGLVVDYSQSMRPHLAAVREAVDAFRATTRPGDEVFLLPFNDEPPDASGAALFSDAARLDAAFGRHLPAGGTALFDAVIHGLWLAGTGSHAKKALVLVSDGVDTASRHGYDEVVAAARRSNVAIHAVGLADGPGERVASGIDRLARLARDSGGALQVVATAAISRAIRTSGDAIRQQYVLGFTPDAKAAGAGTLRVIVEAPTKGPLTVTARTTYAPPARR